MMSGRPRNNETPPNVGASIIRRKLVTDNLSFEECVSVH